MSSPLYPSSFVGDRCASVSSNSSRDDETGDDESVDEQDQSDDGVDEHDQCDDGVDEHDQCDDGVDEHDQLGDVDESGDEMPLNGSQESHDIVKSDLYVDEQLTRMGFKINKRGRCFVCNACQDVIAPSSVINHAYKKHRVPRFKQAVVDYYVEEYKLIKTIEEFRDFLPGDDDEDLMLALQGVRTDKKFICGKCSHAAGTKGSLKTHRHDAHPGFNWRISGKERVRVGVAQHFFFSPQLAVWKGVRKPLETIEATDAMEVWRRLWIQYAEELVPTTMPTRELPPWVKDLGWNQLFEGRDTLAFSKFFLSIKDEPLYDSIRSLMSKYLKNAMQILVKMPPQVRQMLRSIKEDTTGYLFKPTEKEKSFAKYGALMAQLIVTHFFIATTTTSPPWDNILNARQQRFMTRLAEGLLNESSIEEESLDLLHKTLVSLLLYRFGPDQAELDRDPVFMFVIWNNWKHDGSFSRPGEVTQDYAAIQFVARSIALVQIHRRKQRSIDPVLYHDLMHEIHPLMVQHSPTPLGNIYGYWPYLYITSLGQDSIPNFGWLDAYKNHFIYCGLRSSVDNLRDMTHTCFDEGDDILRDEVFLGLDFSFLDKLYGFVHDDTSNCQTGYSFLHDTRNQYPAPDDIFMGRVFEIQGSHNFFGELVNGQWVWNAGHCHVWLQSCQAFLELFAVTTHFTHGQPTRGTEFMSTTIANLPNLPRSIVFNGNEALNTLRVKKTQSMTHQRSVSPHFFCERGAKQLWMYLVAVRPLEVIIARSLLSGSIAYDYTNYLFVAPRGRWTSEFFSDLLYKTTMLHLGNESAMSISALRQILIAIYRHLCNSQFSESEAKSPADLVLEEMGDYQANHGGRIARLHYGVEARQVNSIPASTLNALRVYSHGVHKLWGLRPNAEAPDVTGLGQDDPLFQGGFDTGILRDIIREETSSFQAGFIEHVDSTITSRLLLVSDTVESRIQESYAELGKILFKFQHQFSNNNSRNSPDHIDFIPDITLLQYLYQFDTTYTHFRSDQQAQALSCIVKQKDHCLAILPTGSGKTLLWMLPAKLIWPSEVTVVVLPFVALQYDCEERCRKYRISYTKWMPDADTNGHYSVVLVSPEQAATGKFRDYLMNLKHTHRLKLIVIDEVHELLTAISYRPHLQELKYLFAVGTPVLGLTATIPPSTLPRFLTHLSLVHVQVFRKPASYGGVKIVVRRLESRKDVIQEIVQQVRKWLPELESSGQLGLVVCRTVNQAKTIASKLGLNAYYGDLDITEKKAILDTFRLEHSRVLIGTPGLAIGIDRKNITRVCHCDPPHDALTYVQNIGRLGRDGGGGLALLVAEKNGKLRVPQEDLHGCGVLNELVFNDKQCRKVTISKFMDGVTVSCATSPPLCDVCETAMLSKGLMARSSTTTTTSTRREAEQNVFQPSEFKDTNERSEGHVLRTPYYNQSTQLCSDDISGSNMEGSSSSIKKGKRPMRDNECPTICSKRSRPSLPNDSSWSTGDVFTSELTAVEPIKLPLAEKAKTSRLVLQKLDTLSSSQHVLGL